MIESKEDPLHGDEVVIINKTHHERAKSGK
jgi:hypothetical protein